MEFLDNSCSLSLFLPCSFCYDKNSLFYLIGGTHYEFTGHHPRTDRHNSCTRDGGDGRRSETQRPQALRSWPPIFPRPLSESDFAIFRIFCATMKARIIRRSTFCCAATIRKRFVSSASTSATTVLPTVRRFCARSRKNFPLLFPGLSSSVSTAASRTLTIPRFCIRGQNWSDIRHLLLSAPLHGSS